MRGYLISGLVMGLFIWAPIFFRWGVLHERQRHLPHSWLDRNAVERSRDA